MSALVREASISALKDFMRIRREEEKKKKVEEEQRKQVEAEKKMKEEEEERRLEEERRRRKQEEEEDELQKEVVMAMNEDVNSVQSVEMTDASTDVDNTGDNHAVQKDGTNMPLFVFFSIGARLKFKELKF